MCCLIYEDIIVYSFAWNAFLNITLVCTLIELDRDGTPSIVKVNDPTIYKMRRIYWQIDFSNCSTPQWE